MNTSRILGLDLATHTGYSIFDLESFSLISLGEIDCQIKTASDKNPDHPGLRFDLLRDRLKNLIHKFDVARIYHERTVGGPTAGGAAALVSAGMTAIAQQLAYECSVEIRSVATGTLKKHATGNGGNDTKKQHMIAAAIIDMGAKSHRIPLRKSNPTVSKPWKYDDDVTDAYWAGHYGMFDWHDKLRVSQHIFELLSKSTVKVTSCATGKEHLIHV